MLAKSNKSVLEPIGAIGEHIYEVVQGQWSGQRVKHKLLIIFSCKIV